MQLEREIGKSGIKASAVGLGTWAMGGWMWGGGDDAASVTAIRAALDAGLTLIDTAPAYGLGRAEDAGRTRHRRKARRGGAGHKMRARVGRPRGLARWAAVRRSGRQDDPSLSRRAIGARRARRRACGGCVPTMSTCWITHWQDPTTPIAETMGALLSLKQEGKARAVGISNASVDDLNAYIAAGQVDCLQEAYNMLDRGLEKTLLPVCRREGISVISYSSLALGLLTGRIGPERGVHRRRSQAQQPALLGGEPQAWFQISHRILRRSRNATASKWARW